MPCTSAARLSTQKAARMLNARTRRPARIRPLQFRVDPKEPALYISWRTGACLDGPFGDPTGRLSAAPILDAARRRRKRTTCGARSVPAGNLHAVPCPPFARAPFCRDVAAESGFSYHQKSGVPLLLGEIQPVGDVAGAKRRAKRALNWPFKPSGPIRAIRLRESMVGEPRFRGSISPHRPTPTRLGPSCPPHLPRARPRELAGTWARGPRRPMQRARGFVPPVPLQNYRGSALIREPPKASPSSTRF